MNPQAHHRYRAYICCGPNCGPRGSRSLLDFLADEVARQHLDDRVSVLPTGCQSHCDSGPTMVVYPGPVFYQEMDRDRLLRVIAEHFRNGCPVEEFFWQGPRKKLTAKGEQWLERSAATGGYVWPGAQSKPAVKPKPKRSYEDADDFKW